MNEGYLGVQIKVVEECIKKLNPILPILTFDKEYRQGQKDIDEARTLLIQAKARLQNVYDKEIKQQ